jgi:hypothetical protein
MISEHFEQARLRTLDYLAKAGIAFRRAVISIQKYRPVQVKTLNWRQAIDIGNLFVSSYVKAQLDDRYKCIKSYDEMFNIFKEGL